MLWQRLHAIEEQRVQRWKNKHKKQLTVPMDFRQRQPSGSGSAQTVVSQHGSFNRQSQVPADHIYDKYMNKAINNPNSPAGNHAYILDDPHAQNVERQDNNMHISGQASPSGVRRVRPASASPAYIKSNGGYPGVVGSKFVNKLQEAMEAGALDVTGMASRNEGEAQHKENKNAQAAAMSLRVGPPKAEMLYPSFKLASGSHSTASRQQQQQTTPRTLAAIESSPTSAGSQAQTSWMRGLPNNKPNSPSMGNNMLNNNNNSNNALSVSSNPVSNHHAQATGAEPAKVTGLGYAALVSAGSAARKQRPQSASIMSLKEKLQDRPSTASNVRTRFCVCAVDTSAPVT
jgi:hypothetical protein